MSENDRCVSRDERLTALFDAHAPDVYRFARRLTATADDAVDLVQETFLRAAQSFDRLPTSDISAERAWLIRVALNLRKDQWRKDTVRQRFAATIARSPAPLVNPERAYIDRATVWRALDCLTPKRRAVVTLFELDGVGVKQIAALLDVSVVTVRWHLSRGRKELARAIAEAGRHSHEPSHARAERRGPHPSRALIP
jgi:RNA polymerase sigma-70 factor, ECF subfamily